MPGETATNRRALLTDLSGRVLVDPVEVAETPWARTKGLLGRDGLAPGAGLLITGCRCIHTAGMRFAIDAAFLSEGLTVIKTVPRLVPWRLAGAWSAKHVLELAAGEAERLGLRPGLALALRHESNGTPSP